MKHIVECIQARNFDDYLHRTGRNRFQHLRRPKTAHVREHDSVSARPPLGWCRCLILLVLQYLY
jgi:hypothetical protein